jgi:uncharacterized membrane protein YcaP (DUF421 family)
MDLFEQALGLNAEKLTVMQMSSRAVITFFISLVFVRLSGIRMLGKQSSFDSLTALMLGSIMGRAIVTNQSFIGSLTAALIIMLLHRLMAWITYRSKKAGRIIKSTDVLLIKDGKKNYNNLARNHITEEDIIEAVRKDANVASLEEVKEVHLERSGYISIVKK